MSESIVMSSWRWLLSNGLGNHQIAPFSRKNMPAISIQIVGLLNCCQKMVGCTWEKHQCRRWLESLLRPKSSIQFSDSHIHTKFTISIGINGCRAYSIWIVMPTWCSIVIVVRGYKRQLFNSRQKNPLVSTSLWWLNHTWLMAFQCISWHGLHMLASSIFSWTTIKELWCVRLYHSKALPCDRQVNEDSWPTQWLPCLPCALPALGSSLPLGSSFISALASALSSPAKVLSRGTSQTFFSWKGRKMNTWRYKNY